MDAPVGFRLDGLEIHPETGLVSGPGGREKLNPKVMDVLVLMTRHPRQVVTRDELLERLWPGMVVTDDAVTRCFYLLRRQLSRAGGDLHYRTLIETLPKRGYRFNGEVGQLDSGSAHSCACRGESPQLGGRVCDLRRDRDPRACRPVTFTGLPSRS